MTVSNAPSRVVYNGNGSTTVFAIPFRWLDNSHVSVTLRDVNGVEVQWLENTQYTLELDADPAKGGTLTVLTDPVDYTPQSGEKLVIVRDVPITQESNYVENDDLPSETLERDFDKRTMISQQLEELIGRAPLVPKTDAQVGNMNLPFEAIRAGKIFGFDGAGLPVMLEGSDQSATSVTPTNRTVSRTLAVQAGLYPFFSVKDPDYGAAGDDVTDDAAAIQAADNAAAAVGGIVWFPPGRYLINSTINKDPRTIWSGIGRNRASGSFETSRLRNAVNGPMVLITGDGATISSGMIVGIQMESNAAYATSYPLSRGVEMVDVKHQTIRDCFIRNFQYPIYARRTTGSPNKVMVEHCFLQDAERALYLDSINDCWIEFSEIGAASYGLYATNCDSCFSHGNRYENAPVGAHWDNCSRWSIIGGMADIISTTAFEIEDCEHFTFNGVELFAIDGSGFLFKATNGGLCLRHVVDGCQAQEFGSENLLLFNFDDAGGTGTIQNISLQDNMSRNVTFFTNSDDVSANLLYEQNNEQPMVKVYLDADASTGSDEGMLHRLAATLTADRTTTLTGRGFFAGRVMRFYRSGGGSFNWIISDGTNPIVSLAASEWADIAEQSATIWRLVGKGSLT